MPPKRSAGKNAGAKKEECICSVCEEAILEGATSTRSSAHEAIKCDGTCAGWLHRQCAGLSRKTYELLGECDSEFYCPHCRLNKQDLEIQSLRDLILSLSSELRCAKDELATLKNAVESNNTSSLRDSVTPSYASVASVGGEAQPSDVPLLKSHDCKQHHIANRQPAPQHTDRRFNLVIFGIEECPSKTPRHVRLQQDLDSAADILNSIAPQITSQSVRDSRRLGKYSDQRSRALLVQLTRATDVFSVLANRHKLSDSPGITIKADLTKKERAIESLLLKERWALIQSGVIRKNIKIRGNVILVHNKKHGIATETAFMYCSREEITSEANGTGPLEPRVLSDDSVTPRSYPSLDVQPEDLVSVSYTPFFPVVAEHLDLVSDSSTPSSVVARSQPTLAAERLSSVHAEKPCLTEDS